MALAIGTKAPDFTLTTLGESGPELWTLSEKVGEKNLLLLFVPMAFTGGCTKEFCEITSTMNEYTDLNATVVGISGDNPFAQAAWAEKEGIKMTLLADYEHEVTSAFDVKYDTFLPAKNLTMGGVSKRSAFIIDKEGVVQYAESNDDPGQMPDFAAIKAKLAELGQVADPQIFSTPDELAKHGRRGLLRVPCARWLPFGSVGPFDVGGRFSRGARTDGTQSQADRGLRKRGHRRVAGVSGGRSRSQQRVWLCHGERPVSERHRVGNTGISLL